MFDYEPSKKKSAPDWSGTIIGLMLLPVFFVFVFLGKAEIGFNAVLVLGLVMIAIRLRWKLRKHVWFWVTISIVLFLHVPFLLLIHWPQNDVPIIAYSLPLGMMDFLLISGAISIAQKLFSKDDSLNDEEA